MITPNPNRTPVSPNSGIYTDVQGISALRKGASEYDPATMRAVSQQFEGIFMQMMLKSMRDASMGDELLESDAGNTYLDMHDKQLATSLSSEGQGIGLAEAIYQQLSQRAPHPPQAGEGEISHTLPARDPTLPSFKLNAAGAAATAPLEPEELDLLLALFQAAPTHPTALGGGRRESIQAATQRVREEMARVPTRATPLTGDRDPDFNTPQQFIEYMLPLAREVAPELGVKPEVLVAQAALETGWGRAVIHRADGSNSFNLFNIKADSRWSGGAAFKTSLEFEQGVAKPVRSSFRAYSSYADSFRDYAELIRTSPRYTDALKVAQHPNRYLNQLQQAGYATDPRYAEKIGSILQRGEFKSGFDPLAALHF